MKKLAVIISFCMIILNNNAISAQEEDDVPYLTDDDIASIEITLPEDIPVFVPEIASRGTKEAGKETVLNEITRLNTSQTIYHLLILDRTYCPLNSDISDTNNISILYKLKHGKNGYLIAIYMSSRAGPVFPVLPNESYILVNLMTSRKATIEEYVNSSAFRRFVTSRRILTQIQNVLKKNF
jgi:hypothetical protein